ncbi:MAG TPA: cytochrome P450 [Gemmatimonadaceae bacterium]|nr:cytochrome P450 [Gemmatimonadaceae bacterium]
MLPPTLRPRFPGQLALALARDRLRLFQRMAAELGDVSRVTVAGQHVVLLNHPDLVRDVLVTHQRQFAKGRGLEQARRLLGNGLLTSEGDAHLRQRRLVQPAFHRERIATYAGIMTRYAERESARWRPGETLDAGAAMMRLTLAIAARTLFDADIEAEAAEVGTAIDTAMRAFGFALLPFSERLERLPFSPLRRFERARARLDAVIYRLIAERRRDVHDRGDLLSMLLLAREADGDGGGLTDEQLRDQVMTLLLAGHETTANLLTWSWHLLARHPEAERRLHQELDEVLGGRAPTMDDVPSLPYARRVLAEAMRLYPPAWIVGRRALEPYEVRGYTLPPGTIVLASQYLVHRDPRWHADPERFDPDRWLPEAAAARPRFAYFPFGAGTRVCIGEQFAWTEGVLVLATIARRWRLCSASDAPIGLRPSITLRPAAPVWMRLERRG